jgi:serine/threonine protein kinase
MSLTPGTRLGPYEVLSHIGAGGMGEVYRAKDTRLDRQVAIKVLPAHLSSNPEIRARFTREAKDGDRLTVLLDLMSRRVKAHLDGAQVMPQ